MKESIQLYVTPEIYHTSYGLYDYPSYCCQLYFWGYHLDMGNRVLWCQSNRIHGESDDSDDHHCFYTNVAGSSQRGCKCSSYFRAER